MALLNDWITPPPVDELLRCPADLETATGHFDPCGYLDESFRDPDNWDCAGCGAPRSWHKKVGFFP